LIGGRGAYVMVNTLDMLMEALDELRGHDRQIIEINIAALFLNMVLGTNWCSKHVALGSDPDPWMLNGNDAWLARHPIADDVRRLVYYHRVIRLADSLATLLLHPVTGFDALRERIKTRPDTRASFTETEIASMLAYNGCSVQIIEETGVKGKDFDLLASFQGTDVSVEVTAISGGELSAKRILNKLNDKRAQLPQHRPAVLYVHVPADWMRDDALAASAFTEATSKFMSRSRRINLLVLVWEDVLPFMHGGFAHMWLRPGYNNVPHHGIPDLTVFTLKADRDGKLRAAFSLLDRIEAYRQSQAAKAG
jgi:hypothetical protein